GWTCTATVIRDPYDGQIVGAIDISGLNKTFTPHSLALVATTASRIESQLAKRELNFRYQLLEQGMAKMAGTMDGIIICDRRGHPIKVNEYAKSALLAQGVTLDLGKTNSISSLSTGPLTTHSAGAAPPAWLRADWIEPVMDRGERIGTVVTIPVHRQGDAPSALRKKHKSSHQAEIWESRGFDAIKGNSSLLIQALEKAKLLAKINVPVLLLGETGVGKENFARGMHLHAQAFERPFVALNCGGLSPDLLASELFGYCEGAFTGSRRGGMTGKLEAANGGTLFLDEIGEMPLELQPHFLRVLEEGEIYRIGENTPRKIAFKLIAATNRELRDEVAEGRFRMDLYYRLSVTSIRLPPLRDCKDDIRLLVAHFLEKFARQYERSAKTMDPQAVAMLERYHWPGNVRELRNIVESMFLMSRSDTLNCEDLPPEITASAASGPPGNPLQPAMPSGNLQSTELRAIHAALEADHGNLTMAARRLGIAKSTLYTKIKKYGMEALLTKARDNSAPEPAAHILRRP
ncbi:MAG: sigma-54-dependent Fis family transcriptional regulator, partial [Pollutimonas bauzanensis]